MKIKSLLLASAAAMVSVSGAQAADAVVVEPEPTEYVRICDAYGAGFFYIPGTETCMKFSGYVRTVYTNFSTETDQTTTPVGGAATSSSSEESTNGWATRARFDIDTRNETDLGTLRALIRFQASAATDDGNQSTLEVDQAFITLAGFRAGIGGSLFNANNAIVNLAGVAGITTLSDISVGEDFNYGFSNSHVADFTYAVGDLLFAAGIEDKTGGGDASDASFLAKIEYAPEGWRLGFVAESEESDENSTNGAFDRVIAYKVYGDVDLSEFVPGGIIGGWYMGQEKGDQEQTATRLGDADNIWGVGFQMDVTDNIEFVALHSQWNDEAGTAGFTTSGGAQNLAYTGETQATTVGLNWYPVDGLKVFGTYSFGTSEQAFTEVIPDPDENHTTDSDFSAFTVGLRRSF